MARLKKITAMLIGMAMLLALVPCMSVFAAESGTCGDNVKWTFDDDGTLTISGMGDMDNVANATAPWDEYNSNIKKVVIQSGVTSIGKSAFYGCYVLTSIEIPDSVTSIGNNAFYNCIALTSIEIPDSVTSIGIGAFSGSGLTSVSIPVNVTSIGDHTFNGCGSLASVSLPASVKSIGAKAFYYCKMLTDITIPDGVTSIGDYAFYGCSALTSVNIPDSVTSIGEWVFYGCSALTSINIPKGVTSIGANAFNFCSALTSIEIPDGVTSIGDSAFDQCTGLTSVKLPNSLTNIGSYAFYKCSGLTNIEIPNSVTSIGTNAFQNCSALTSINIPEGVKSVGQNTFNGCSSLTSIEIPDGVTEIGMNAFKGCENLKSISIPASVTSIGSDAFKNCSSAEICYAGTEEQWKTLSAKAGVPNGAKVYAAPVAELAWDEEKSVFGINFVVAGADGINIYANGATENPMTAELTPENGGVGLIPKSSNSVYRAKAVKDGDEIGEASKPVSLYSLVARAIIEWNRDSSDMPILKAQLDEAKRIISKGGFYIVDGQLCGAASSIYSIKKTETQTETKYTITLGKAAFNAGLRLVQADIATNLDGSTVTASEDGETATITVSSELLSVGTAYLEEIELVYAPEEATELEAVNGYEEVLDFTEIL